MIGIVDRQLHDLVLLKFVSLAGKKQAIIAVEAVQTVACAKP